MNISKESLQKIAAANQANPYADITPYETGVGMPIVHYSGFLHSPVNVLFMLLLRRPSKTKTRWSVIPGSLPERVSVLQRCHRPHGKFRW